jgi:hypothetical protein
MKHRLAILLFVLIASLSCAADMIRANISAVFTGTNCAGCTEVISISFQYDPTVLVDVHVLAFASVISLQSSGFMGSSFSTDGQINASGPLYMPLLNGVPGLMGSRGDEIDINFAGGPIPGVPIGLIQDISIWSCQSPACQTAYGFDGVTGVWAEHILPTSQTITYTSLPEPATVLLLCFGLIFVRYKLRRGTNKPNMGS